MKIFFILYPSDEVILENVEKDALLRKKIRYTLSIEI